jgi:hypothetical protein
LYEQHKKHHSKKEMVVGYGHGDSFSLLLSFFLEAIDTAHITINRQIEVNSRNQHPRLRHRIEAQVPSGHVLDTGLALVVFK